MSIERATNVASAPIASEIGLNGRSSEPSGVDFVIVPERRRRRVLPLRQAVDLVVEEQDLQVHVAAQRVDQVVAADRERVAVAGHDPHREVGPRDRQARRDRRRATVDRVHPVRLHVVREPRRAADAGDEDDVLARHAELRHERLQRGEDRVVAAARAPADFLVGLEVLGLELGHLPCRPPHAAHEPRAGRGEREQDGEDPVAGDQEEDRDHGEDREDDRRAVARQHHSIVLIASATSLARSGRPRTRL